jgi:DUF1009 family protein
MPATGPGAGTGAGKTLAIIAGWGRFPFHVVERAKAQGYRVVVAGINGEADPALASEVAAFTWTSPVQLARIARFLRAQDATVAVMAGGVRKTSMFGFLPLLVVRFRPDWTFFKLWFRGLADKKDATLLGGFAHFLEEQGVHLAACSEIVPDLLGPKGPVAGRAPSEGDEADLAFGYRVARELARLDIGQTVLVKERAVIAVEAIEGTDNAIRRAGEYCRRGGFTLVKVARPAQDMRFDVPTIGPATIEVLAAAGGRAIGYEAGRTLVLDVEETLRKANERGILVIGMDDRDMEEIEARHRERVAHARSELGTLGTVAARAEDENAKRGGSP